MGRVTINRTVAQFSCKQSIPKGLWDAKGNKAKGKSQEAREINLPLDNTKAQIIKHYQRISDREAYVTAFIKERYKRNDMSMLELTPDFIKEFAAYLTTERNLKNATIWLDLRAHYNGLIPRNAFAQFHISPNVKEREYLTEDELKILMTHDFEYSRYPNSHLNFRKKKRKKSFRNRILNQVQTLALDFLIAVRLSKPQLRMKQSLTDY